MIPDHETADGAGIWWDGALNPMSPEGLRAALAQEDDEALYKPSDIRWVAWPGYGDRVHVSQVAELMPIWLDIETKRLRRYLLLAPLGMLLFVYRWFEAPQGWIRTVDAVFLILGLVGCVLIARDMIKIRNDPKTWGLAQARRDARRAGLHGA